jgi:SAM-dependent methyltransferase
MHTLYYLAVGSLFFCFMSSQMACLTGGWDRLKESQNVDELMRFVREDPKNPNTADALRRVELLHYRDAVAVNTPYAYRLFLRRHPGSVHSIEVKHRLEDLEFENARKTSRLVELKTFLNHWPDGRYASRVAGLIDQLECKKWLSSEDPEAISKFEKAHPAAPCKDKLKALVEKLLFARACESREVLKLLKLIDTYPSGQFTQMARQTVVKLQVQALLEAARFKQAKRAIADLAMKPAQSELTKTIEQARLKWVFSTFDPRAMLAKLKNLPTDTASLVRERALAVQKMPLIFAPLADATRKLRSPLVSLAKKGDLSGDPLDLWTLISRLAFLPNEQCADFLLAAISNLFIEVRRRALCTLREVLKSMGKVRSESWLHGKIAPLEKKARGGTLLLKLGILLELAGDKDRALAIIMRETENSGSEDIFPDYLAARLSTELDNVKRAATMAKRFSEVADRFCKDRITAWREGHMTDSQNGWLTLRQLFGAIKLWNEVLRPFIKGKFGKKPFPAFESFLGPWLTKSGSELELTKAFLDRAESGWADSHAGYHLSAGPHGTEQIREQATPDEKEALSELAFCGRTTALKSISWSVCCHPRKMTRLLAASVKLQVDLLRSVALLWPLLDCVP